MHKHDLCFIKLDLQRNPSGKTKGALFVPAKRWHVCSSQEAPVPGEQGPLELKPLHLGSKPKEEQIATLLPLVVNYYTSFQAGRCYGIRPVLYF